MNINKQYIKEVFKSNKVQLSPEALEDIVLELMSDCNEDD